MAMLSLPQRSHRQQLSVGHTSGTVMLHTAYSHNGARSFILYSDHHTTEVIKCPRCLLLDTRSAIRFRQQISCVNIAGSCVHWAKFYILQIFEACESVLRRDPACLLAALCDDGGPLRVDRDGTVYVDRDWCVWVW